MGSGGVCVLFKCFQYASCGDTTVFFPTLIAVLANCLCNVVRVRFYHVCVEFWGAGEVCVIVTNVLVSLPVVDSQLLSVCKHRDATALLSAL